MKTVAFVPFEVPGAGASGLGLGIAALAQGSLRARHANLALLRAYGQRPGDLSPQLLEGFFSPSSWQRLMNRPGDHAAPKVDWVVTGRFEPAQADVGQAELVVFEPRTGALLAHSEALYGPEEAGEGLWRLLEGLSPLLELDLEELRGLRELEWSSLEHALRAEAVLAEGGGDAELAAFVYYARAVEEAGELAFLRARLTQLGEHLCMNKIGVDTVSRALSSLSPAADTDCALAAASFARGESEAALGALAATVEREPQSARAVGTLARLSRLAGEPLAALQVLDAAMARGLGEPRLDNERLLALIEAERVEEANELGLLMLEIGSLRPIGLTALFQLARAPGFGALAGTLVDRALMNPACEAELLVASVGLLGLAEPPGLARDVRLDKLLHSLEAQGSPLSVPLARALAEIGEPERAARELQALLQRGGAAQAAAAEELLMLSDPEVATAIRATLRAAHDSEGEVLERIAERARHYASVHGVWTAHLAYIVAERRLGHLERAHVALEQALASWPECPPLLEERAGLPPPPPAPPPGRVSRWWSKFRAA